MDRAQNQTGASRLLSELRQERLRATSAQDPGQKMAAAFSLSVEARKLMIAGLRSQGFTESEIRQILKAGRR